MKRFIITIFLLAIYFGSQASAEMLKVDYSKEVSAKGKKDTTETLSLILDKNRFILTTKSSTTLVDLGKEQVITMDNHNKHYLVTHLYSWPVFTKFELKNREIMTEIIQAAGVDKNSASFDPFYLESELGMVGNLQLKTKPQLITKGNSLLAKYKEDTVTMVTFADDKLANIYKNSLKGYLRYFVQLHPDTKRQIIKQGKLFAELSYTNKMMDYISHTS
jgi:hypothetical protein